MKPEKTIYIVLAICVLHNYLLKKSPRYTFENTFSPSDKHVSEREPVQAERCNTASILCSLSLHNTRNVCLEAKENREKYLEYFNGVGKIDFQDEMIQKGKA